MKGGAGDAIIDAIAGALAGAIPGRKKRSEERFVFLTNYNILCLFVCHDVCTYPRNTKKSFTRHFVNFIYFVGGFATFFNGNFFLSNFDLPVGCRVKS